ncbi:hypothetical protein FACS1894201_06090 [Bacteroidia bacterium]|nr:hypothetical protein FACS1894201_06090 [Bacteroidia bacterium]
MKYARFLLGTVLLCLLTVGCLHRESKNTSKKLARVYDTYLYESDLTDLLSNEIDDSTTAIQNYVNNWIQQQLITQKAEKNLPKEKRQFEQEIKNYRNSLIVYAYQNELVNQNVDTNISDIDVSSYYEANKAQFQLRNNIVRVCFVKLPYSQDKNSFLKQAEYTEIRDLIFRDHLDGKSLLRLSELCSEYAEKYYLDYNNWLYFNDLLKDIPIETSDQESYLRQNKYISFRKDNYLYRVNIMEYRLKDQISPIAFEDGIIRNIILNRRKVEFINNLYDELWNSGKEKGYFEIFN